MAPTPRHEDAAVRDVLTASIDAQHAALRAWGLPPVRLLVLYNACAHRCFFCASAGTSDRDADDRTPWDRIAAHLAPARPEEQGRLVVAGNEPLLHPDFERLMDRAHAAGFTSIELMTSGADLADRDRLQSWVDRGLSAVAVPIYAVTPALHDDVVGGAAHARLLAGLDAARDAGVALHLHTLGLRRTVHELPALARLTATRWGSPLGLALVRDKEGQFDFAKEALSVPQLGRVLGGWPATAPVRLIGFPGCVAPHLQRDAATAIAVYFRTQRTGYAAVCRGCAARRACPGVVQAQLARTGSQGLAPR